MAGSWARKCLGYGWKGMDRGGSFAMLDVNGYIARVLELSRIT